MKPVSRLGCLRPASFNRKLVKVHNVWLMQKKTKEIVSNQNEKSIFFFFFFWGIPYPNEWMVHLLVDEWVST